jgi:hypothetical protein
MYNGTVVELLNLTMIVRCIAALKTKMPEPDYAKIKFCIWKQPGCGGFYPIQRAGCCRESGAPILFLHRKCTAKYKVKRLHTAALKNIYSDLFYTLKLIEMVYLRFP